MDKKQLWNVFMYLVVIILLNLALVSSFGFTAFQLITVDLMIAIIFRLSTK